MEEFTTKGTKPTKFLLEEAGFISFVLFVSFVVQWLLLRFSASFAVNVFFLHALFQSTRSVHVDVIGPSLSVASR